jgi:undecaprenyl-diphosphatase
MDSPLTLLKAIGDIVELALVVGSLYFAMRMYLRRAQPAWAEPLDRRRLALLWLLALGAAAVKLTEDVLGGESGPIDKGILLFLHAQVPSALTGFFDAVTLSASAAVLTTLTIAATIALAIAKRRFEAMLLAGSVTGAAALVYAVKVLIGRERPMLWDAQWYWGSSFPSGHTLVVAAFAAANALILGRLWPAARLSALVVALMWVVLVAFSRLILGVHWPTDVLAAACIGAAIPLGLRFILESRSRVR